MGTYIYSKLCACVTLSVCINYMCKCMWPQNDSVDKEHGFGWKVLVHSLKVFEGSP